MKNTFHTYCRRNWLFWAGMLLLTGAAGIVLAVYGKIGAQQMLNACHTPAADVFFRYYTYVGGGFPTYFALAVLLLWRLRDGVYLLAGQLAAALLTQPLKCLFAHPRPVTLFNTLGLEHLPFMDIAPGGYTSFPSGHTSAAFALFACLAALLPYRKYGWQLVMLFLAALVAYSRIYLSAHFLDDLMAGAPVGALAAAIAYIPLYAWSWGDFSPVGRILQKLKKTADSE
ncbi:MAG: phosphatase PAP2 family protein [Paludibacteraceae bacterium]|nr:phosphatase PAP2 family protein [Paludibacteraceae bacterium]